MKYCNLIGPLQVVYFTYTPVKRESSAHISTYTPVIFMTSSKWCRPLDAEQLMCHNAGIVTTCLLKLLYKHYATCALLAIQNQR